MSTFLSYLLCGLIIREVGGLGCISTICSTNEKNELIQCEDGVCGYYKSRRQDGLLLEGIDMRCDQNSEIYAPFDGQMYFWRPYGNAKAYECADFGVRIEGSGQWQGFHVLIASVALDSYGGNVKKGQRIGRAKDRRCMHQNTGLSYIRFQLFDQGSSIDPTHHLQDCMCTGQICETNRKNLLIGAPFKSDSRYNGVRGWEIKCNMIQNEDDKESRVSYIYSPIDAKVIGRSRLYSIQGAYGGCDNNGIILVGTGEWTDFEVVLYNVHYLAKFLGQRQVSQGDLIGIRLACHDSPDSVFMEVRYRGNVVDISDMVLARNCKMPEF